MKTIIPLSALLLATAASAGVRVENVTRNIETRAADGPAQITLIQDGKVRASSGRSNSIIIKDSTITLIDDGRKTYSVMDKAQVKQMASQANAAMAQMQERLQSMSPEQRQMMEKMMGGALPGGLPSSKPDVYAAQNSGRSDTVEGRKCAVWTLTRNGKLFEESCVVPFASLPGAKDVEKSLRELAEAFAEFAKGMPSLGNAVQVRSEINGYPVRVRSYDGSGKLRGTETVLAKWAEESLPAASFEVPKGYARKDMPQLVR